MASVGEQPYLAQQQRTMTAGGGIVGAHYGEVVMELVPAEEREITSAEILQRWRELTGPIPGAVEVNFNAAVMSAGDPIYVQFSGTDIDELKRASEELKSALASYDGVLDISDSFRGGKQEVVLDILPSAEALGLSRRELARQVRQGFYGEEAQRIQRGRDEVKVMVRYPEQDRRSLLGLEQMRIRTADGSEVPFSAVASSHMDRGYATIRRTDRRRTVDVTADVDLTRTTPNDIVESIQEEALPRILAAHPSVSYSLEGQTSDQAETIGAMARFFAMALLGIFALMAIPFRSYVQPLIVMTAIPFGIVGAVLGHKLMGMDLSILSVLGIAALAGVVVNDSLVLVDFVNRGRRAGRPEADAARNAGVVRFRPILLTSLTTFAGLTPLLLEKSVQAQFLVPMAVSLAFGVIFATTISLILVPCMYLILEDTRGALRWVVDLYRPAASRIE
jgi:multidrug efflux pump subunit AcrB